MSEQSKKNYQKLDYLLMCSKFQAKPDTVLLKLTPSVHCLSKEEQKYFVKITEGIFGYNEQIRNEYLKFLSTDYHVTLIQPFLCAFIKETIYQNIALTDLTLLIYAVRMTKCLITNNYLCLKPHIHEILPAILSCALAKKISKYYYDNHWTLRDFSTYIVATICEKYNDNLNNMRQRVIEVYKKGIRDMNKTLTTAYGAIRGLSSLGEDTVKIHLIPEISIISTKIQKALETNYHSFYLDYQKQQMSEAKYVRDLIVMVCSPVLYEIRNVNDGGFSYLKDFGCLGKALYIQVKNIESLEQAKLKKTHYVDQRSTINTFIKPGNMS